MSKTTTFQSRVQPTTGTAQYTYDWLTAANWTNGLPVNGDTVELGADSSISNDDITNLSLAVLSQTQTAYKTVWVGNGDTLTVGVISQGGSASRLSFDVSGTLVDNSPTQTSTYFAGNYYGVEATGKIVIAAAPTGEYEYGSFGGTLAFEHPNAVNSARIVGGGLGYLEVPGTAVTGFSYTQAGGLTVSTTAGSYAFPNFQAGASLGYTSATYDASLGLIDIKLNSTGSTPAPTTYQLQTAQKNTSGPFLNQYVWSNPNNWSNTALPLSNSDIADSVSSVDDIGDYSINHLTLATSSLHLSVAGHLTVQYLSLSSYDVFDADSYAGWATTPWIVVYHISGSGGTIGAHGAGVVTELLDTFDAGENYSISSGAEIYLNYSLSASSTVSFTSGGYLALANPASTISTLITGVSGGANLELPGSSLVSLTYSSKDLTVTTNIGSYSFTNFNFSANVSYYAFSDQSTGLLGVAFVNRLARKDFDGDGVSDILWFNTSSGTVLDWTLSGGGFQGSTTIAGFAPNSGWSLAGTGDFDGDGTSDVLLRYVGGGQTTLALWEVKNGTYHAYSTLGGWNTSSGWAQIGVGDFTGDGTSDVLLSFTSGGNVRLYDFHVVSGVTTATDNLNMGFTTSSGWAVIGTGDFNGDGVSDILFQNSASGLVADWAVTTSGNAGTFKAIAGIQPGSGWTFDGVGDFNGDGTSDILWQNGSTLAIWDLAGGAFNQSVAVTTGVPSGFVFKGIGDYFGKGFDSSVLWQNQATGEIRVWEIVNNQFSQAVTLGGPNGASGWQIIT